MYSFLVTRGERILSYSPTRIFTVWVAGNACFALLYTLLVYVPGNGPTALGTSFLHTLENAIYFTFVTTFTIGYGDIVPQGLSRALVVVHSFFGTFLMVAFTTKVITRRQDKNVALMREMVDAHTMRSVREELFQFRRDLERVESNLKANLGILGEYDWELLGSAALHSVVITHQIEALLLEKESSSTVHEMYEVMVLESLYRSIKRLHHFLTLLPSTQRSMPEYEYTFFKESEKFVQKTREVLMLWKSVSPVNATTDFDEHILELCAAVEQRIQWSLQLSHASGISA